MDQIVRWPPSWSTLLLMPALFLAFTVHELAHALVAFLLGDTSQVERKRLSFNPLRHVSWLGMVAFLLVGLGWAKPVWFDPQRFRIRNRALGVFLVSVAGVSANFLLALAVLLGMSFTTAGVWLMTGAEPARVLQYLLVARPGPDAQGVAVALSYYMLSVNLLLAAFNLIPLPPLDGFQALVSLVAVVRGAFGRKRAQAALPSSPPTGATDTSSAPAVARTPAEIHFEIGLAYHKEGQLDEAIARYRQALDNDDKLAEAYYNMGLAYWAKGRPALATSSFNAALRGQGNPAVRMKADERLRDLAEPDKEPGQSPSIPAPLELGTTAVPASAPATPLDPVVLRRVWLRLGVGGLAFLVLAVAAWLYVTGVTWLAMVR